MRSLLNLSALLLLLVAGAALPRLAAAQGVLLVPTQWVCPVTEVGGMSLCTLTGEAANGSVTFKDTKSLTLDEPLVAFEFVSTTCAPGQTYLVGHSCSITLRFKPTSLDTYLDIVRFHFNGLSRTVEVVGQVVVPFTYAWIIDDVTSACGGGTWNWLLGEWLPAQGCGRTSQSRTATCTIVENSGVLGREVYCRRSDGTTVADSKCDSTTRPSGLQSCTPGPEVCGDTPITEREELLSNICMGAFSSCVPDAQNGQYCLLMPF